MNETKSMKKGMLIKWFLPYFKKHKKVLVLDLMCALLTTLCELVLPMIIREITSIATTDISALTVSLIVRMASVYIILKIVDMIAG